MNIIYLDIDGVMAIANSPLDENRFLKFTNESIYVLKELLKVPNTFIVVSSSWKIYKTVAYLKDKVFKQYDLDNYILDKTKDLEAVDSCITREDEIVDHILNYRECNKFIVLDDIKLDFTKYGLLDKGKIPFLNYHINGYKGLTKKKTYQLF